MAGDDLKDKFYGVDKAWFARRNRRWRLEIDAFAEDYNAVLGQYWTPVQDAMKQDWRGKALWLHCDYQDPDTIDACVMRLVADVPKRAVMLAPLSLLLRRHKTLAQAKHLHLCLAHDLAPFVLEGAPAVWGHDWGPLGFLFQNIAPNDW